MIKQIDKVFLEAAVIFQNGSALLPKGYENIAILANHYNKPLVITSGSWNYCRISITSYDQLERLFGQELLLKYDWIGSECITLVCMEFGSALPSQISYQV
jgi:translation initiation factor 2B subunit (eIF-2B alpha/beta/delta family)